MDCLTEVERGLKYGVMPEEEEHLLVFRKERKVSIYGEISPFRGGLKVMIYCSVLSN